MDSTPLPDIKTKLIQHKKQLVIVTAVFVFVLFIALVDWNWFRPSLVSYTSQKSGRDIRIGHLDVDFSGFLNPTIQLQNVFIPNASWSDKRPLIDAKRIAFTFNTMQFLSNLDGRFVSISMSDSEVNLERLPDGLRNWRLLQPDYKGPGIYIVRSLTAERSHFSVKNHALDLDLVAKIEPNSSAIELDSASQNKTQRNRQTQNNATESSKSSPTALPNKITFSGRYLKAPFNGVLFSDATMTFKQTEQFFHVNGYLNQAKNTLRIDGKIGDVMQNPLIDANIESAGDLFSIVNLIKSTQTSGKDTFKFSTHLFKKQNQYEFKHFAGELNDSDLKGELSYFYDPEIPKFSGKLTSQSMDFKNVVNVFGRMKKVNSGTYRSFSLVDNLKRAEMDLNLNIRQVKKLQPVELGPMNLDVSGRAGKFDVDIKDSQLNGGKLSGNATLNFTEELANTGMAQFNAQINLTQLQIARLLDATNLDDKLTAPVAIKANLHSGGNSFANIIKRLSGDADVTIGKGAISNKLDAKLGLDFGKMFWLSLRGDKNIVLNCGKLGLDIKQGVAISHTFWVNTAQTIVEGKGSIDLNNQRINVLIDPQPKDPSLFSTSKSIQVSGQLGAGDYVIKTTDSQLKKPLKNASHVCP